MVAARAARRRRRAARARAAAACTHASRCLRLRRQTWRTDLSRTHLLHKYYYLFKPPHIYAHSKRFLSLYYEN